MSEEQRVGIDYLQAATELLQRIRREHQTAGLFEAADLQWWWRAPRSTDRVGQLFWFDEHDRPEAAVIATDWVDEIGLDVHTLPDASPDQLAAVVERGFAHAADCGFDAVTLEVDLADADLQDLLAGAGFGVEADGRVETWLPAAARPQVTALPAGYRLVSRVDQPGDPHHLIPRNGDQVEARLRQTMLYRPDLDLVVKDRNGAAAAYGLFWFDPETATGLVEPMRTEDEHQGKGLARHVLTRGVDLLARAGATRIKVCYETDNPPARDLYLSAGFRPVRQTVIMSGHVTSDRRGR